MKKETREKWLGLGLFGIIASVPIAGMAVAGCNNRCDDKQSDTNKLYLIHQETTPFGIDYDLYDSEKLPGAYMDYGRNGTVDLIFPDLSVYFMCGEGIGQERERLCKEADKEIANYRENRQ